VCCLKISTDLECIDIVTVHWKHTQTGHVTFPVFNLKVERCNLQPFPVKFSYLLKHNHLQCKERNIEELNLSDFFACVARMG